VGGAFDKIGGQARRNLAALDAGSGSVSGWDPAPDDNVYAILPACGTVYAGGAFQHVGRGTAVGRNFIAAFDPTTGAATSWNPDAQGHVDALARRGSTIYAGGSFGVIGGQVRQKLAEIRLSDGGVTSFAGGGDGPVNALALSDSGLYVGGQFSQFGGASRQNLAVVDPATGLALAWSPSVPKPVLDLSLGDDYLYAGGMFGGVGASAQRGFARFGPGAGSAASPTSCVSADTAGPVMSAPPAPAAQPRTNAKRGTTTPLASRLGITPSRLRLGRTPLVVRFRLLRSARVSLRVDRRVGRRYRRFATSAGLGHRGLNRLTFRDQRIGKRRLLVGRYRLTLSAPAGPALRAYFTVVR
jgi:hypothetical protein